MTLNAYVKFVLNKTVGNTCKAFIVRVMKFEQNISIILSEHNFHTNPIPLCISIVGIWDSSQTYVSDN